PNHGKSIATMSYFERGRWLFSMTSACRRSIDRARPRIGVPRIISNCFLSVRIAVNVGSACTRILRPRLSESLVDKTGGGGSVTLTLSLKDRGVAGERGRTAAGFSAVRTRLWARVANSFHLASKSADGCSETD